jgi:hypothetical protein
MIKTTPAGGPEWLRRSHGMDLEKTKVEQVLHESLRGRTLGYLTAASIRELSYFGSTERAD